MSNVIEFKPQSGYSHVMFFLNGLESDNTIIRYERDIKRFIKWKYDISLEQLRPEHFNSLTYTDMKKYRDYLRGKYSAGTTNNNMFALYSLFKELNKIQGDDGNYIYDLNIDRLKVRVLKDTTKDEYGYVEWEEMDDWIRYLSNLPKRQNPMGKAMWIELARTTGIRKQGLANLKFKDLKKEDGVYTLTHTLKGKKRKIAIPEKIAKQLLELKKTSDPDESILKMSTKTMERTFDEILDVFQIPEERNIVIHSIRGESGYEAYLSSGKDITVAQNFLGHEDANTTLRYINKRRNIQEDPSLYMGKKFSNDDVDGLTNEQFKKIYNELSRSAKYEILRAMDKLGYSQE